MTRHRLAFDEIGEWSELKLEIVRKYAGAYSRILANQRNLTHYYIDGFAGKGAHISRSTGEVVPGSPLNALNVNPPFKHYYFVDLAGDSVERLREFIGRRSDVSLYHGDCNTILVDEVLPSIQYAQFRRALCLLDPYGLHLHWKVIAAAGAAHSIDLFLNFPIMDMNRNAFWTRPELVDPADLGRMSAFWGDESWRDVAYQPSRQGSLFGEVEVQKRSNDAIANAFRDRLQRVAGFADVPAPIPMRNRTNAVLYYLFFASPNENAGKIANDIFRRHSRRDPS